MYQNVLHPNGKPTGRKVWIDPLPYSEEGYTDLSCWNCRTKNGDSYTGEWRREGEARWWIAIDSEGREYETEEQPTRHIDLR